MNPTPRPPKPQEDVVEPRILSMTDPGSNPCCEVFKAPGNPEPYEDVDPDYSCPTHAMLPMAQPRSDGPMILSIKDSNPKDAVGIRKAPMSTVSAPVMLEVGAAMMEGALKYGRHNYRAIGVRTSVYYDACLRHLFAFWEGEDIDAESGISHITKAIAGLMVLRDAQIRGKVVDDRPVGTDGFVEHLNRAVGNMIDKVPEPKDAFVADGQPQDEYKP